MIGVYPIGSIPIGAASSGAEAISEHLLPCVVVSFSSSVPSVDLDGASALPVVRINLSGSVSSVGQRKTQLPTVLVSLACQPIAHKVCSQLPAAIIGISSALSFSAYSETQLPQCIFSFSGFAVRGSIRDVLPTKYIEFSSLNSGTVVDVYVPTQTIYRAFIGGYEVPIKSVQMRLRRDSESYIAIVVPDAPSYVDGISSNINEGLVVYRGVRFSSGLEQLQEYARGVIDYVSYAYGARSRSATIVAYGQNATAVKKSRTIAGASYTSDDGVGSITVRAIPDEQLRAGDIAVLNSFEFEVRLISVFVGLSDNGNPTEFMEVSS